jgi:hypothetical protein
MMYYMNENYIDRAGHIQSHTEVQPESDYQDDLHRTRSGAIGLDRGSYKP